jgi:hypothetical protein
MNLLQLPRPIRRQLIAVLLACAAAPAVGAAQETNRPVKADYAAFKIVNERNIFNANRSGGPVRQSRGPRNSSKVDAFRLVGIMEYDKGAFAFFDGTSSDYKKALQTQGKIAGYTVTNVAPTTVILATDGKQIELHVGMQVRREDSGEWQVAASEDLPASSGSSPAASEGTDSDSGAEVSDVLKRLMQQKEKE